MNISGIDGTSPQKNKTFELKETTQEVKQQSIFSDKNGNNIVDAEDFENNEALLSIVKNAGWLNNTWDEVGKFINDIYHKRHPYSLEAVFLLHHRKPLLSHRC